MKRGVKLTRIVLGALVLISIFAIRANAKIFAQTQKGGLV
jgi:hypothetical protein